MDNIVRKSVSDIDLNKGIFHFTTRERLENISKNGLKATIGDISQMKSEEDKRVYMSLGAKGILGIKNSLIYEFKKLRICDIPFEYRKYFSIVDYSSTELVRKEMVYEAMEKRFKDEVYLLVDAKEGEDYLEEDIHGLVTGFDIKGKPNHDISPEKLSLIVTSKGDSALALIQYIYNRLIDLNPEKEDVIKEMNLDLSEMLDYIKERDLRKKNENLNDKNEIEDKSRF